MLVAGAAEVGKFAEALAVGLDTELCKASEHRNTDIVRLVIDSDQYKISASSSFGGLIFSTDPR